LNKKTTNSDIDLETEPEDIDMDEKGATYSKA
jgi:hypothetical protein